MIGCIDDGESNLSFLLHDGSGIENCGNKMEIYSHFIGIFPNYYLDTNGI